MKRACVPRACYIRPSLLRPVDRWAPLLERCAHLGFAEVILPCPFVREDDWSQARLYSAHRLAPAYGVEVEAIAGLSRICAMAAERGLKVLVDIRLDQVDGGADLATQFPRCFRPQRVSDDPLPDPRREPTPAGVAVARFRSEPEALVQWWAERMLAWCSAGIGGFRCLWPQRVPRAQWSQLIAAVRRSAHAEYWAWTPGLDRRQLEQLAPCGFDAACSSLAWWDFRADWFLEEDQQLRRFPAAAAVVNDPHSAPESDDERVQLTRMALAWAAAAGDGLLVALGPGQGLERDITEANARIASLQPRSRRALRPLLANHAGPAAAWLLQPRAITATSDASGSDPNAVDSLLLANTDLRHLATVDGTRLLRNAAGCSAFSPAWPASGEPVESGTGVVLEPGEVRLYRAERLAPLLMHPAARLPLEDAAANPRVAIEAIAPAIDGGRFPIKRIVGQRVAVQADAFSDGHDLVAAALLWREAGQDRWQEVPMRSLGNDRWSAEFAPRRVGRHEYTVEAWRDEFATARMDLEKRRAAGRLEPVDVDEAGAMIATAAETSEDHELQALVRRLSRDTDMDARCALLVAPETAKAMARSGPRPFRTRHRTVYPVEVEREASGYSSWYELFPRSQSTAAADGEQRHGTFDDVIQRLPAIRDMGFDVLYMPPIHPIGRRNRKGRNNSVTAEPGEPGSPYAIGADEGGHDAIHPQLGTLEDFRRLLAAAADEGLELALDFAIQCSPDHPWLREHPDWFAWRADGSIRYAENPPKKYEDIVNVDFYADGAIPGLWLALRDVVAFWVNEGVRLFRVDNPHTKPFPFWEWLIGDIRARHPDVVFLSEAFTRPKLMYRLAKLGYSQSYTYFTWRNTKDELTKYLTELAETDVREYFRPHFFVNTPDINPVFLQQSGRAGHIIRAVLASTLSGLWGIYSGFELCEATPQQAGKEDYLDSEKYQLRDWDWQRPGNIIEEITRLNRLRRMHPALQTHLGVKFYNAFNDHILYFGKRRSEGEDMVLVAINLDPHRAHETDFELPLWEWGLGDHESLQVEDLWRGTSTVWSGKLQHLRLDPEVLPFSIWRVGPQQGVVA